MLWFAMHLDETLYVNINISYSAFLFVFYSNA